MLARLGRLYSRRIVNVNVNVIVAGVLALVPTLLAVHFTYAWGWHVRLGTRFGIKPEWIITAVTFLADVLSDVVIYYALHWLANHWPRMLVFRREAAATPHLTFFRDATLVQVERAALSPLLYLLFLGTQHVLVRYAVGPVVATVIGFVLAISVARTLHTMWMLWRARRPPFGAPCSSAAGIAPSPDEHDAANGSPPPGASNGSERRTPQISREP